MARTLNWSGFTLVLSAAWVLASAGSSPVMAQGSGRAGYGSGLGYSYGGLGRTGGMGYLGNMGYSGGLGYSSFPLYGSPLFPYYNTSPYPYQYSYSYPHYKSLYNPGPSYYDVVPGVGVSTSDWTDPASTGDNKAHLTIHVPVADAVVKVDGQETTTTGTVRYFQSPELAAGNYSYEVQAT